MTRKRPTTGLEWPMLAFESWCLGAKASWVILLRCNRLAGGGASGRSESLRMVSEKWQAQTEIAAALAAGHYGSEPHQIAAGAIDHYRRKVRANRKRLSR